MWAYSLLTNPNESLGITTRICYTFSYIRLTCIVVIHNTLNREKVKHLTGISFQTHQKLLISLLYLSTLIYRCVIDLIKS